jgi:long-subunit fatty acid transport protein
VSGTQLTLSVALIRHSLRFARAGAYDAIPDVDLPYEGAAFAAVTSAAQPRVGIGRFQAVPILVVASDLGERLGRLRVAAGVYAPNAYPARDLGRGYVQNGDPAVPPPPTRYDVLEQDAVVVLPSVAAAYRITSRLDVGARISAGYGRVTSTVAGWSAPENFLEDVRKDAVFEVDATDRLVPGVGLGATYHVTPGLQLAIVWASPLAIAAQGTARVTLGSLAGDGVTPTTLHAVADSAARCARGGTDARPAACIQLELPMTATLAVRRAVLDRAGATRADVELDVGWERWGRRCDFVRDPGCTSPGQYRVVIDAEPRLAGVPAPALKDAVIEHGLRDTISVRLGGSYRIGEEGARRATVLRGGLSYDTRAARAGWLRADLDGAARVTAAVGAAYRAGRVEIHAGGGYVLSGSRENPGTCNPSPELRGCRGDGSERPIDERRGPDPINPLVVPARQAESPVGQGMVTSSYALLMVGVTTWL